MYLRRMQDLRAGDGPKPKVGDTVVVSHPFFQVFSLGIFTFFFHVVSGDSMFAIRVNSFISLYILLAKHKALNRFMDACNFYNLSSSWVVQRFMIFGYIPGGLGWLYHWILWPHI